MRRPQQGGGGRRKKKAWVVPDLLLGEGGSLERDWREVRIEACRGVRWQCGAVSASETEKVAMVDDQRHVVKLVDVKTLAEEEIGAVSREVGGVAIEPGGGRIAVAETKQRKVTVFKRRRKSETPSNGLQIFKDDVKKWEVQLETTQLRAPTGLAWVEDPHFGGLLFVCDSNGLKILRNDLSLEDTLGTDASRDVAVGPLLSSDDWERDAPTWYLGPISHDEAVEAMRDCGVGEWRVRRSGAELALCYVTESAWRRADVDERTFESTGVFTRGPFRVKIQRENLFCGNDDAALLMKNGRRVVDGVVVESASFEEALSLAIRDLALDPWPLERTCRPKRQIAVALKNKIALYHYAPRRDALFKAQVRRQKTRYAGFHAPRSVAFASNGDLAVGDLESSTNGFGRVVYLSKPDYDVVRIVVLQPPRRVLLPVVVGSTTHCAVAVVVDGAMLGAPVVKFFAGDRCACVAGGRAGPLAFSTPPSARTVGSLGAWSHRAMSRIIELLGYVDSYASLRPACRGLRDMVGELRRGWRMAPFDPDGLREAESIFYAWARTRQGQRVSQNTPQKNNPSPLQDDMRRLERLKSRLDGPSPYALSALSFSEVAPPPPTTARDAVKNQQADSVLEDAVMDFGRGLLCAVTAAYGPSFWFRRRGALAVDFADLAVERDLEDREVATVRGDPRCIRLSRCRGPSAVLERSTFLEFWTRLREKRLGLAPWPRLRAGSPASMLLARACGDGFSTVADVPKLDPIHAHIAAVNLFQDQAHRVLDRIARVQLATDVPTDPCELHDLHRGPPWWTRLSLEERRDAALAAAPYLQQQGQGKDTESPDAASSRPTAGSLDPSLSATAAVRAELTRRLGTNKRPARRQHRQQQGGFLAAAAS